MTDNTNAAGGRIWTPDMEENKTVHRVINALRITSSILGMAAVLLVILKSVM